MAPTNRDAQRLIDHLEGVLRDCEQRGKVRGLRVTIKGAAPAGPKIDTAVNFEPALTDAALAAWATGRVREVVAEWEGEVGLWVDHLATTWTAEATPRRGFDCRFRMTY